MVTRGLYWEKFKKRFPDNYDFEVLRLDASVFSERLHEMMEQGDNGHRAIGEGVFACASMISQEDPFITFWLLWFYESIFFAVATGPKGYLSQFVRRTPEPKTFGLW